MDPDPIWTFLWPLKTYGGGGGGGGTFDKIVRIWLLLTDSDPQFIITDPDQGGQLSMDPTDPEHWMVPTF